MKIDTYYRKILNMISDRFYPIHYYNFWKSQSAREMWLSQFIESRKINNKGKRINFCSVLGIADNIQLRRGSNVFFSGENMHTERFQEHRAKVDKLNFDLYIDFDTTLHERNSIRFPLWLFYMFSPDSTANSIRERVDRLRFPTISTEHDKFCSLVSSHDWNGIRGSIVDDLSKIGRVELGGHFRKNTEDLFKKYKNNKHDFIKSYKFNICSENSNNEGYVTEKIFQAIDAGCIPIYWGSNNKPEIDILNQERIVFWEKDGDNIETINLINKLQDDADYYLNFAKQPCLVENAEDKIIEMFDDLERRLKNIL